MEKRIDYIDIARGIGIFLVVLGHAITKDMTVGSFILASIRNVIYAVHMPLFFIISGWLFERSKEKNNINISDKSYCLNKCKIYAIPYLIFTAFVYLVVAFSQFIPQLSSILRGQGYTLAKPKEILYSILAYNGHLDQHLWFAYTMLLVLLLSKLVFKEVNKYNTILMVLFYIFTCFVGYTNFIEIIWRVMRYLLIFQIGRIAFKYNIEKAKYFNLICGISSVFSVVGLVFSNYFKISYLKSIFVFTTGISVPMLMIFVLCKFMQDKKWSSGFLFLGKGKMSYAIYLLHMPFLTSGLVFVLTKLNLPIVLVILLSTFISLGICIFIYSIILKRAKWTKKILFGEF